MEDPELAQPLAAPESQLQGPVELPHALATMQAFQL